MNVNREQFMEAFDTVGLEEDALRERYSGRGMYGRECVGIVCDVPEILLFAAALGSNADDWDWVGNARSDSMGRGTIWYWPGVQLERSEDDEDKCDKCGASLDDGEGYDGYCGDCADKMEAKGHWG